MEETFRSLHFIDSILLFNFILTWPTSYYFISVLHFIWRSVIWCTLQIKWLILCEMQHWAKRVQWFKRTQFWMLIWDALLDLLPLLQLKKLEKHPLRIGTFSKVKSRTLQKPATLLKITHPFPLDTETF